MKRIYLDYAAATPIDLEVKQAMMPYFNVEFGNPGSLHSFGQKAMAAVDESREKIAKIIGANFREIIFTSSATEANNLALRGVIKEFRIQNLEYKKYFKPRIIISSIEHGSVIETARDLEKEGVEVIYLPVSRNGLVDLKKLKSALNEQTVLVSVIYVSNVIGVVQPITKISEIIREFKQKNNFKFYPLLHTDAAQAFQYLDCDVNKLGVDLMTFSGQKIYGPKGIGMLYAKSLNSKSYILNSIITGGNQEFHFRSGTENVPAIVGFAKAIELTAKNREKEREKILNLSLYFLGELKKICPKVGVNGKAPQKIPSILNIYFPGHNALDLLIKLDMRGIAVSIGSACSARLAKSPHVLQAIGLSEKKIKNSLRFAFGRPTNKKEIDETLKKVKMILK